MNALMPPVHLDAARIVQASGSSFVPAFRLLPKSRRRDLETFYAFCRVIDDVADSGDYPMTERRAALEVWRRGFLDPDLQGLPENLRDLIQRHSWNASLFLEILDGTETDLNPAVRMPTRADLDLYCHRVAGVVGQLCLAIFGAHEGHSSPYAEALGRALQYTNILRDTAADRKRNRIYFPLDELAEAGLTPGNFAESSATRQRYLERFANLAEDQYREADRLLPSQDRKALRPAVMMGTIYQTLLRKMQRDGLRVMEKRYRLSTMAKFLALLRGVTKHQ
jgi:phytoene synthase